MEHALELRQITQRDQFSSFSLGDAKLTPLKIFLQNMHKIIILKILRKHMVSLILTK